MTKYHINEATGQPNVCTATKKACPIGGEHFDSKDTALEAIQTKAAAENETFVSLKKSPKEIPERYSKERIKAKLHIDLDYHSPDQMMRDVSNSLRYYAERLTSGCGGCDGSGSDYCRCAYYTGSITATATDMAEEFYDMYKSDKLDRRAYSYDKPNTERDKVVEDLSMLLQETGVTDGDNFDVISSPDYYGEALEAIEVTRSAPFEALYDKLKTIFED